MSGKKPIKKSLTKEQRRVTAMGWRKRFQAIIYQNTEMKLSFAALCRDGGFEITHISHMMAGRKIPKPEYVDRMEDFLKSWGV